MRRNLGYVDGPNISIDYVSALAAELVRRKAEVIVARAVQNVVAVMTYPPIVRIE